MSSRQFPNDSKYRHVLVNRNCIAVVLHKVKTDTYYPNQEDGHTIFTDFLQQNSMCFWNACLMRSVASLEYRGCLVPTTLLISGTNFALEVIRSAWARRVLRPPKGYTISKLGDVGMVDMLPVPQTQFAPLSEALCKVVADLNGERTPANAETIRCKLEESFPEMQVPCEDILHKTLGGLIRERKIYHTGNGYFVVSPDTYRQRTVPPQCERQMLMTNEEAIVKLHGENRRECSLAVQVDEMDIAAAWKCSTSSFLQASKTTSNQSTQVPSSPDLQLLERSHSLRVLRVKGRPKSGGVEAAMNRGGSFKEGKKNGLFNDLEGDVNEIHKNEKQSMLAKILKRMQFLTDKSAKHVVFSAQFPPLEWLEGDKIRCHSVATQTQLLLQKVGAKPTVKRLEPTGSRIPWEDTTQNNFDKKGFSHYTSPNISHRKLYTELDGSSPRKNMSLPVRQNHSKYSPSHRYSHGTFTNYSKRRHRHRRSSSESPKVQKSLLNGYQSQSTSSKSNADNSDDKAYRSSSSGSALIAPLKVPKAALRSSSKEPESMSVNSFLSKEGNISGRESSTIKSPSSSLDREVLKDIENISTLNSKSSTTKIENMLPNSQISGKVHDVDKKDKTSTKNSKEEKVPLATVDQSILNESSCSEKSVSCNGPEDIKPETIIRPLVLKSFVDIPTPKPAKISPKEILIDNSVSVEVALDKSPSPKSKTNNVSTTIVTEETTVTKANGNAKVVTVTSITTSLSPGGLKDAEKRSPDQGFLESDTSSDKEKSSVNDLNIETEKGARIIDCSSSCNIVTEVK